jgi:hypothetical protein
VIVIHTGRCGRRDAPLRCDLGLPRPVWTMRQLQTRGGAPIINPLARSLSLDASVPTARQRVPPLDDKQVQAAPRLGTPFTQESGSWLRS